MKRNLGLVLSVLAVIAMIAMISLPVDAATKERYDWIITKRLTVMEGGLDLSSPLDIDGNKLTLDADGDTSITVAICMEA